MYFNIYNSFRTRIKSKKFEIISYIYYFLKETKINLINIIIFYLFYSLLLYFFLLYEKNELYNFTNKNKYNNY